MSLISALVAVGTTVICEHSITSETFRSSAQITILSKIPPNDSRLTYVWQDKLIHYVSSDKVVYLVVADDTVGRRTPFAFLQALEEKVRSNPSFVDVLDHPHQHGLQSELEPELQNLMQKYSSDAVKDPLKQAKTDMNNVKDIMVQNIDSILARGERIEVLVDKTDSMAHQAHAFRRGARGVRRQMWWKNTRIMALSVVVCVLLLYLLLAQFCGLALGSCR
ncbi:hypothetical protein FFLO_05183 [Filobasidium floriforme]|uniref:Synaptobrevin homolog YKT6 n=1 Tax=Filobasidium floriforme TaxID=5210 RepID=A0A8K0NP43_9TREE|nr:hypothetical protein FFLO_05183 [Filobasidium floriforme]